MSRQHCSLFCETLFIHSSFVATKSFLTSLIEQRSINSCLPLTVTKRLTYRPLSLYSLVIRAGRLKLLVCVSLCHGCQKRLFLGGYFFFEGSWLTVADTDKLIGKLHQCCTATWREKKPSAALLPDIISLSHVDILLKPSAICTQSWQCTSLNLQNGPLVSARRGSTLTLCRVGFLTF